MVTVERKHGPDYSAKEPDSADGSMPGMNFIIKTPFKMFGATKLALIYLTKQALLLR